MTKHGALQRIGSGLATLCLLGSGCSRSQYHPPQMDGSPYFVASKIYGHRPNTPFLYTVSVIGDRPMLFTATGLPEGLDLDEDTGIISGSVAQPGDYEVVIQAENAKDKTTATITLRMGDNLALTPPMGWMSWNQFGPNISEDLIKEIADAMVESGMRDVGYQYIFIDDHWHGERDADGFIHPNPAKFPNGMKALADYVHSKGLKLGIYSDAADQTCGGEPGSIGHEEDDAFTYANWGIDYLKYDYCGAPEDRETAIRRYSKMSEALDSTDRTIVFGVCEWGRRQPWLWAAEAGGQLWRTTWDIHDIWDHGQYDAGHAGIVDILDRQVGLEEHAGPGRWNDPDMLVVGLNGEGLSSSSSGASGCSEAEYRSNMTLWSLLAAPLYATSDIRTMDEATRSILTNPEAVLVNQDPLGRQASRAFKDGDSEVWAKPLSDGHWAIGLLNRGERSVQIRVDWNTIGIDGKYAVRDLWRHEQLGVFDEFVVVDDVASHETILLRLWPVEQ